MQRRAAGLIFACLCISQACAEDVRIIANPSVKIDTITTGELKRVFLEENISIEGSRVEPVLGKSGPAREAFLRDYLGTSQEGLQAYYRTLVFTGRGSMPKTLGSDAEVVAYVGRTPGAIGYVSDSANTEGVKTLVVEDTRAGSERKLIVRIEPDYPEALKQLKIGGTVRLRISISAAGAVEKATLLGGNPILGRSAVLAVKKWVYAASPSRTIAEVTVVFNAH